MLELMVGAVGGGVGRVVEGCWFGVDMLGAGRLFRFGERGVACEGLGDVPWRWASIACVEVCECVGRE